MADRDDGSFLDHLTDDDKAELAEQGERRMIEAGVAFFHEGDPSSDVFVLLEGQAKVVVAARDGRELLLVIRSEGDIVGELAAIDSAPRSASVIALEDCEVVVISAERFRALLDERPRITRFLLFAMAARMRQTSERQLEFGLDDALGRVCRRLIEMGERYGTESERGVVIDAPLSQRDMASWSGISRQAVVKALKALRSLGWIETHGTTFVLLQPEELRERAALVSEV